MEDEFKLPPTEHDFKRFPELTNSQMNEFYFNSPHKQITENFNAQVVEVHDGDTIKVKWIQRDFAFKIRFADTAAPELNEAGGKESQQWLEQRLLNKMVDIQINPNNRVGKFGRLLGTVLQGGQDVGQEETIIGLTSKFGEEQGGKISHELFKK
jgi:endonuclease YncB( thermonuclease family)